MNTPLNIRLAAAVSSMAITFCLISMIATMAKPPIADVLVAQGATALVR